MKTNVERIAYYTRKVKELFSVHITKRNERWYNRASRLKSYKKAMNKQLEEKA